MRGAVLPARGTVRAGRVTPLQKLPGVGPPARLHGKPTPNLSGRRHASLRVRRKDVPQPLQLGGRVRGTGPRRPLCNNGHSVSAAKSGQALVKCAEPARHFLCRHESRVFEHCRPTMENHEMGNSHNPVARRQLRITIRVDFEDDGLARKALRDFRHFRRSLSARTAPRCPEVHQNRHSCLTHNFLERCRVHFDGLGYRWERSPAGSTAPLVGKVLCRYPIATPTLCTSSDHKQLVTQPRARTKTEPGVCLRGHV